MLRRRESGEFEKPKTTGTRFPSSAPLPPARRPWARAHRRRVYECALVAHTPAALCIPAPTSVHLREYCVHHYNIRYVILFGGMSTRYIMTTVTVILL